MSTQYARSSPVSGGPSGKLPMTLRLFALLAWFLSRGILLAFLIHLGTGSTWFQFADRPLGLFTQFFVVATCELAILFFLIRTDAKARFWHSPAAFYLFNPLTLYLFVVLDTKSFILGALLVVCLQILEAKKLETSGLPIGISLAIEPSFLLAAIGPLVFVFLRRSRVLRETRAFVLYVFLAFGLTTALRALAENAGPLEPIGSGIGLTSIAESADVLIAFETLIVTLGFAAFLIFVRHVDSRDLAVLVLIPILCSLLVSSQSLALEITLVITLQLATQPYGNLVRVIASALTWLITLVAVLENQTFWREDYVLLSLNLFHILQVGAAFALIFLVTKHSLLQSPYRKLASQNVLILIAGDSGTGKDTLSRNLANLLESDLTAQISGDDYHKWPRNSQNWNRTTHLNVSSNRLSRFYEDVTSLVSGYAVAKPTYNHASGRFRPASHFFSKLFVVASGLHALYFPHLNERAQLKVYLEMSEDLRTNLKIARDTGPRNHTLKSVTQTIERRAPDSRKFIDPQSVAADLVVTISSRQETDTREVSQIIEFTSHPMPFDDRLIDLLRMVLGADARQFTRGGGLRTLQVCGFAETAFYSTCFRQLQPLFSSLNLLTGQWKTGPRGMVQFITALYLAENLKSGRL